MSANVFEIVANIDNFVFIRLKPFFCAFQRVFVFIDGYKLSAFESFNYLAAVTSASFLQRRRAARYENGQKSVVGRKTSRQRIFSREIGGYNLAVRRSYKRPFYYPVLQRVERYDTYSSTYFQPQSQIADYLIQQSAKYLYARGV